MKWLICTLTNSIAWVLVEFSFRVYDLIPDDDKYWTDDLEFTGSRFWKYLLSLADVFNNIGTHFYTFMEDQKHVYGMWHKTVTDEDGNEVGLEPCPKGCRKCSQYVNS